MESVWTQIIRRGKTEQRVGMVYTIYKFYLNGILAERSAMSNSSWKRLDWIYTLAPSMSRKQLPLLPTPGSTPNILNTLAIMVHMVSRSGKPKPIAVNEICKKNKTS